MATVLVTGASGYIGRFLVKELLEKGETVFVLLRRPAVQLPELQAWLEAHGVAGSGVQAVTGDLSQPGAGVDEAGWRAMAAVTVIFHSGALFGWNLPEAEVRAVNVVGAVSLLETAAATLSLQRFVQVSGYMLTISGHLAALVILGYVSATDWPAIYRCTGSY